jgi:hypothetical protein
MVECPLGTLWLASFWHACWKAQQCVNPTGFDSGPSMGRGWCSALPLQARPVCKVMLGKSQKASISHTSWNHHHLSRAQPSILDPPYLPKGFNLTWESELCSPHRYPATKGDWWQGGSLFKGSITIVLSLVNLASNLALSCLCLQTWPAHYLLVLPDLDCHLYLHPALLLVLAFFVIVMCGW